MRLDWDHRPPPASRGARGGRIIGGGRTSRQGRSSLDFGGPLRRTPFELLRATERRLGLPPLTFDWRGPFDPDGDPLWQRLQARMIGEPDPGAYRAALDVLAVTAPDVIFVDDQPVNVDGARAVGIPAILFDVVRPAESYARALTLLDAQS